MSVVAALLGRSVISAETRRAALGRTDIPVEQAWEAALHDAAAHGDLEMARLLLRLGADRHAPRCRGRLRLPCRRCPSPRSGRRQGPGRRRQTPAVTLRWLAACSAPPARSSG